jgi:LysM repeat protein
MKIRTIIISIVSLLFCSHLSGQNLTREQYIQLYKDIAIDAMKSHGIPASITLAQGCLESGNGNSDLARKANNHFGIKCHNDWTGGTYYKKDDDPGKSCFRKYKSPKHSFEDHSDFIRYRQRYAFLFDLPITDYRGWSYGLKKAGYATDPEYAEKLINIIEDYKLYQYDTEGSGRFAPPPSPSVLSQILVHEPAKSSPLYMHSSLRTIYEKNGVPFIISKDGDTYESIAREYNLFKSEILRYNDLGRKAKLKPGTIVYLQKKKKKSPRYLDIHIAEPGDTYYDISQKYAIRLNKLYEYNNYKEGDILHPGDEVFLRKKRR